MCCLIIVGTCDIFQDSLINKKLKISVYSKYKCCVTICTTIQKFGVSTFFLSYLFIIIINIFIQ